ncbi:MULTISPECIES: hypothetical protein [Serratia]|nr:hypothetical protein [Serratia marcescens]MBH2682683.1 hypothetical protein [Serratia marcescens]MDS0826263.1 hypothetical protein [Serratia marcescens]MDZ7429390.1 hypothetical protein [Serratia marcescens]MDZ7486908.1 hypothetical protein [Serratia marcescens]MDZ7526232.1 hypothetical protein [Serratia marcescens]
MKSLFCNYAWDDFSQRELRQLKRGIQRLRVMLDMFAGFNDLDFRVAVPGMPEQRKPKAEKTRQQDAAARLQSRADLLQRITALHVKH